MSVNMRSFSPLVSSRRPHPGPRTHSGARACGAHLVCTGRYLPAHLRRISL